MKYITDRIYAIELLEKAYKQNAGPWYGHSLYVAKAAEYIASELVEKGYNIDSDIAYCAGLLHDIGRFKGFTPSVIHSYDGYMYLEELGYIGNAVISVTHSFPCENNDIVAAADWTVVPIYMKKKIEEVLDENAHYNIYNKIITLCDALADENGFTTLEKRFISVGLRYGTDNYTAIRWRGFYEIKKEIESFIGRSVYRLLPGIEKSIYTNLEF